MTSRQREIVVNMMHEHISELCSVAQFAIVGNDTDSLYRTFRDIDECSRYIQQVDSEYIQQVLN